CSHHRLTATHCPSLDFILAHHALPTTYRAENPFAQQERQRPTTPCRLPWPKHSTRWRASPKGHCRAAHRISPASQSIENGRPVCRWLDFAATALHALRYG